MKYLIPIGAICTIVLAFSTSGCGKSSATSECSCEICINDVPAYPSDSEESCAQFAAEEDCASSFYTTDDTQTCGSEAQPVCEVSDCNGQCQCPDETNTDISFEFKDYEE